MRMQWMAALVFALGVPGFAQAQAPAPTKTSKPAAAPEAAAKAPPVEPKTEDQKIIYLLGLSLGQNVMALALTPEEVQFLQRGIQDALNGTPPSDPKELNPKLQSLAKSRQAQINVATLDRASKEPGATRLPSGVIYRELKAGTGKTPRAIDTVKVHYRGTLVDGTEFDSSYKRGEPIEFPLNGVIPCWTQGVQKMKVGAKAKLTCPASTAYGERPPTGSRIPPNAVLQFDVELVDVPGNTAVSP